MRDNIGLFRGRRLDNGEFVEGAFFDGNTWAIIFPTARDTGFVDRYSMVGHQVDRTTVGECSGVPDRNGKKIYEHDRCRVTRPGVLAYGKITFANGCFWFKDDGPGGFLRLCDLKVNNFEIEVLEAQHD
jgi:hypothetical protein